jgi:hypothetical protein
MDKNAPPKVSLRFKTKAGNDIDIPVQGCLGLLAYGDLGLLAWRKTKHQHLDQQKAKNRESVNDKTHEQT